MKKSFLILAVAATATLLCAETPKPVMYLPMNEGDNTATKEIVSGSAATLYNPDMAEWEEGPNGKAFCFKNQDKGKMAVRSAKSSFLIKR